MAGILDSFNPLLHFLCPSPNSLRRLDSTNAVGVYKFWTVENEEAPIRLCKSTNEKIGVSSFEIKSLDHTANHYIALAGIIAAGINGILSNMLLPMPCLEDPKDLDDEDRKGRGINLLPKTFSERMDAILSREGDYLRNFFGEEIVANIMKCHEMDHTMLANKTLEEEV